MMFLRSNRLAAAVLTLALVGGATSADAATIAGLFNTGTTSGNGPDAHWTLIGGTAYNGGTNGQFPLDGPWLSEDDTSRWLTPSANAADNQPGSSTYSLVFDLTGFKASTAQFTARAASDDSGELFLNGNSIGTVGSYGSWTEGLGASQYFVSGRNELTFVTNNSGGGPSGGRLEFLSSSVAAVPEPATWGMMILGLGVVGGAMRGRRRTTRVAFAA